jgi:hypothetical protein
MPSLVVSRDDDGICGTNVSKEIENLDEASAPSSITLFAIIRALL